MKKNIDFVLLKKTGLMILLELLQELQAIKDN